MKSFVAAAVTLLLAVSQVSAFTSSFSGSSLSVNTQNKYGMTMEYIPSGISKEQWKKMKEAEKKKASGKNLGKSGITTFKSRSFSEWQKAGGKNLFPGKFLFRRLLLSPSDVDMNRLYEYFQHVSPFELYRTLLYYSIQSILNLSRTPRIFHTCRDLEAPPMTPISRKVPVDFSTSERRRPHLSQNQNHQRRTSGLFKQYIVNFQARFSMLGNCLAHRCSLAVSFFWRYEISIMIY